MAGWVDNKIDWGQFSPVVYLPRKTKQTKKQNKPEPPEPKREMGFFGPIPTKKERRQNRKRYRSEQIERLRKSVSGQTT